MKIPASPLFFSFLTFVLTLKAPISKVFLCECIINIMKVEKKFSKVQRKDPVSRILGYLKGQSNSLPIVFNGERCYGFINEGLLISTKLDMNQQLKGFDTNVKTMNDSKSASDIAEEMLRSYCPYAPFGENDREESIFGYIKACAVINELLKEKSLNKDAGSISKPVVVLNKDDSVGKAINFLKNFRAVPLVDVTEKLYGCIEQRGNFLELAADRERPRRGTYMSTKDESIFKKPVIHYATKSAPACETSSAVGQEIIDTLDTYGYCFVCRASRPVGILTPLDVLKVLY
jgi:predicted transcriptional regulator